MRFFDAGEQAEGIFAFGQFATGVVAVGQVATGVIAIGQVARGVIAIGQGAVGIIAVGQGSLGALWALGMIGVGGKGMGIVLPLLPSLGPRRELPPLVPLSRLADGGLAEGWARIRLARLEDGSAAVRTSGGAAVEARIDVRLRAAVEADAGAEVLGFFRQGEHGLVLHKIARCPESRLRQPRWWLLWSAQMAAMVALCGAIWALALWPVMEFLARAGL